ncbi:ROK family protein, partial [Candidatus Uhrbacteria bacterium]|nr:ROK family protein [Candidatus Uhrbacteria bacterium]
MILALDIGGTKIATGLVDEAGQVSRFQTHPTITKNHQALLDKIFNLVSQNITVKITAIAIGIAGQVDAAGIFQG